jgi:hypothetical protein
MADVSPSPSLVVGAVIALREWFVSLNLTMKNFVRSGGYALVILLVFWCAYLFERNVLNRHPMGIRFIREGSEAAMRYITIPHIIIGFLFMVSSPKNQTRTKRMWVAGLFLAGVALCMIYGMNGGKANTLLYASVYLYFLVHELRDEAMFYTVLGDAAPIADKTVFQKLIRSMVALIVLSVAAVVWSVVPFGALDKKLATSVAQFLGSQSLGVKLLLSLAPSIALAAAYRWTFMRYSARLGYSGPREMMGAHSTLFKLMFAVPGVLFAGLVLTQRPYMIILFHVVAWYVFALYQFKKYPPRNPIKGLWSWMRATPNGFRTLHIGLVIGLMMTGLVWTLWLGQTNYLYWLLAPDAFLYWTIMHITVSFVPR